MNRFERHFHGAFGRVQNARRGIFSRGTATALIEHGRDPIAEGARRLQRDIHVGHFALHQTECADRLAKLFAIVHIRQHQIHRRLHDADRTAGQHRAFGIQSAHQHLRAAVKRTQHILFGDFAVFKYQLAGIRTTHAEFVELLRGAKTLHAFFDNKRGHRARALILRRSTHVHNQRIRMRPVGDPHLAAVGDVTIAFFLRAARHRTDHIGTRTRLGHCQRADKFART